MRLYADAAGGILRAQTGVEPGAQNVMVFPPLDGVASTLDLDDETNGALAADLTANAAPYRLSGGVLSKAGAPITIAAPSRSILDREYVQAQAGAVDNAIQLLAGGGALTNAQRDQAILTLLRALRFVVRWILKRD